MLPKRRCFVCNEPDEVDAHHVLPCEYGGPKDGRTVDLCTRHHRLVHRAAEQYAKSGTYTNNYQRLSEEHRQRADVLIKYILHQKREHEDSGKALADTARNTVAIQCTPEELALFHAVKTQMGMKSLARAIKLLVMKEYQRQNKLETTPKRRKRVK